MNRVDRLLAIVLELQANGWMRAEDLAAHFEISKRTIYRDMQALSETGVPVIASPGQGYALDEAYFLPPLQFTADEATLILLGLNFVARHFDPGYRVVAHSAQSKIGAVMNDRLREEIEMLRRSLAFIAPDDERIPHHTLQIIRRAIIQRRSISMIYHAGNEMTAATTERQLDPYALVNFDAIWFVSGYCHLRQELRNFRLDRIGDIHLLAHSFRRDPDYRLVTLDSNPLPLTVRVRFKPAVSRWVREDRNFYTTAQSDTPDGLLVTLQIRHERDILRWLLGWGAHVEILEPDSLRLLLLQEAQAVFDHLKQPESLLP